MNSPGGNRPESNSRSFQHANMKVKLISDTVWHIALPKVGARFSPKLAISTILSAFLLLWTVAAASNTLALAQQTDTPSATKPDAQPQADAPTAPDSSSDDSTEATFPHFKDTR